MVELGLGHLFISSSSNHVFNKTDFDQYLFEITEFADCWASQAENWNSRLKA